METLLGELLLLVATEDYKKGLLVLIYHFFKATYIYLYFMR